MESSFRPSVEELNSFLVASLVTAAALTAYTGRLTLANSVFYLAVGSGTLLLRELGQRVVAQWMDAYVDLELSLEGSAATVIAAGIAVVAGLPLLILLPVFNSFSGKRYEHWGKTITAVWSKRQYWIVSGGIVALLAGWATSYTYGWQKAAEAVILFTFFQLLPIRHPEFSSGDFDGFHVLRHSGFIWLLMMGFTLVAIAVTV